MSPPMKFSLTHGKSVLPRDKKLIFDAPEPIRPPCSDPLIPPDEFELFMTVDDCYNNYLVPMNGINKLLVKREELVKSVVSKAETSEEGYVYISGGAGFGKTILLCQIAQHLKQSGKNTLIALDPGELDEWFESQRKEIKFDLIHGREISYLIVDDAHQGVHSAAVNYLTKNLRNRYVTIFAGLPTDEVDSFFPQLDTSDLLLAEKELLDDSTILHFLNCFQERCKSYDDREQSQRFLENAETAVKKALRFSLHYSGGQCYPCLKLAEFYCEKYPVDKLISADSSDLLEALSSDEFTSPNGFLQTIIQRCFMALKYASDEILSMGTANEVKLFNDKWVVSPLLHMILLKDVLRVSIYVPWKMLTHPSMIGEILSDCFRELGKIQVDEECENKIGFLLGEKLASYCELVLPLHGAPESGESSPFVEYYLNSKSNLSMHVLILNRSLLHDFFRRSHGSSKTLVGLDINDEVLSPEPLPAGLEQSSGTQFFTYCVRTCTLYNGNCEVVNPRTTK